MQNTNERGREEEIKRWKVFNKSFFDPHFSGLPRISLSRWSLTHSEKKNKEKPLSWLKLTFIFENPHFPVLSAPPTSSSSAENKGKKESKQILTYRRRGWRGGRECYSHRIIINDEHGKWIVRGITCETRCRECNWTINFGFGGYWLALPGVMLEIGD